jgi:hypothetical protein
MKIQNLFPTKSLLLALLLLVFGFQSVFAVDASTSVKFTVKNVTMSVDAKQISYDVYAKDVDAVDPVQVGGFTIRLAILQTELGTNDKTVTVVAGPDNNIGTKAPTMTLNNSNWLMKFQNNTSPVTNAGAMVISDQGDGTLLATFSITNADGTAFANPLNFTLLHSGTTLPNKSNFGIFEPGTTNPAANSTAPQPASNFIGLGAYSLSPPAVVAPSGLSYTASPITATAKTAIVSASPTVTGTVVSYSVSPALPAGLSINATTGVIGGTPTAVTAQANYTVTASNSSGNTTAVVVIKVNDTATGNFIANKAANVFSIYPNPCTTEFSIQGVDNYHQILNVYDLTGRKQIIREIAGDVTIDTSVWPAGIYTIDVNGVTTKLIKK